MCCSRGHYPVKIGAWRCDECAHHVHTDHGVEGFSERCNVHDDHIHIVLPTRPAGVPLICVATQYTDEARADSLVRIGSCVTPVSPYMQGLGFIPRRGHCEVVFETWEIAHKFRDLVALGVAEGGIINQTWVDCLLDEFVQHEGAAYSELDRKLSDCGPAPTLEYHEWLIQQAQREAENLETT